MKKKVIIKMVLIVFVVILNIVMVMLLVSNLNSNVDKIQNGEGIDDEQIEYNNSNEKSNNQDLIKDKNSNVNTQNNNGKIVFIVEIIVGVNVSIVGVILSRKVKEF